MPPLLTPSSSSPSLSITHLRLHKLLSPPARPLSSPPSPLLLSVLHLASRENEVAYDVVAVVDPLTREAQKISSLLTVSPSHYFLIGGIL